MQYYPYGQFWNWAGPRISILYGGLEWGMNDPLYPSATREYNNGVGRWMTPDPGGRKVVNLANPQTWNMYAYVTNNPMTFNDPSGMQKGSSGACGKESPQVCGGEPKSNSTLRYKARVPPARGALKKMLACTQGCTGFTLTVTSTTDEVIRHGRVVAHGSNTPHGKGEAADIRANRRNASRILSCGAECGAEFGLNEVGRHPAGTITTGGHVHLQIVPGRDGGRGDLPPALMPSHPVPDPEPPHPVSDHSE